MEKNYGIVVNELTLDLIVEALGCLAASIEHDLSDGYEYGDNFLEKSSREKLDRCREVRAFMVSYKAKH